MIYVGSMTIVYVAVTVHLYNEVYVPSHQIDALVNNTSSAS